MKKISAVKRRVPKNTQTLHKTINPHPNIFPQTPFELLPDPNKTSTIKTDPTNIKDSAINVCTLNIRSLTIKEDSIKLKRFLCSILIGWLVYFIKNFYYNITAC